MLQATHVHTDSIRPDVITRSGTIQPFPFRSVGPVAVARAVTPGFVNSVGSPNPSVDSGPAPEMIARTAEVVASAMARGIRPPPGLDPRILKSAEYIRQGKPFVIRSAGRAAIVRAAAPASLAALRATQGGVAPGNTSVDVRAPLGIASRHRR
jgi:hypothetical protein